MLLTDGGARRAAGRVLAVILSPLIVLVIALYAMGSGAASHNAATVRLCFDGGPVPAGAPEEYRQWVEGMQLSFEELDAAITVLQSNMEDGDSLDTVRVKAIFYALYFGAESRGDARAFASCFVTWEERTRTVTDENGEEVEEQYAVTVPIADEGTVWRNIAAVLGEEPTAEQRANAERVYELVR